MVGLSALLLTPYGLMVVPFILAGLLVLWIIRRVCRPVRIAPLLNMSTAGSNLRWLPASFLKRSVSTTGRLQLW